MDERSQSQNTKAVDQTSNNAGMLGGMTDQLGSAVGAGQGSGAEQSYLGKGITAVQQSVFGQSASNEERKKPSETDQEKQQIHAAVDQAHPEKIQEFMRDKYMSRTDEMNKEEGRT